MSGHSCLKQVYRFRLLLAGMVIWHSVDAQEAYKTGVNSDLIKTLQVRGTEILSDPIIELNGGKQIEINFDALESSSNRFAYIIEHCDADWKKSEFTPIEYLDGFQGMTIDDFANSIATTQHYTNFNLRIPNDDVKLKVSGNYAVKIYRENEPDKILVTACFSVVESLVKVTGEVTGNTLKDFNKEHQQVNFTLFLQNFAITYPQTDLRIYVFQNRRRDNVVTNLTPTSILRDRLVYDQNRKQIFEAGNEYRRFEFLSNTYNGMGVERIRFQNPYYHVFLQTGQVRSNRTYQYDQDQDGRFLIRCSKCDDPDTEADYDMVHFGLNSEPLLGGSVYLLSDIYNNVLDERSKMGYNFDTGQYEKSVLLKQGNYNYSYLFVPNGQTLAESGLIEGNFYQTENEYAIFVYYRPFGARYDRLISVTTLQN